MEVQVEVEVEVEAEAEAEMDEANDHRIEKEAKVAASKIERLMSKEIHGNILQSSPYSQKLPCVERWGVKTK